MSKFLIAVFLCANTFFSSVAQEEVHIFERIKTFKENIKYVTGEDVFFHQDLFWVLQYG